MHSEVCPIVLTLGLILIQGILNKGWKAATVHLAPSIL